MTSPRDLALSMGVDREVRRSMVAAASGATPPNGIDRVEVLSNMPGSPGHVAAAPRQRTLLAWMIRKLEPGEFGREQVVVLGGVRPDPTINPVRVEWAHPAEQLLGAAPPGTTDADRRLVANAVPDADWKRVLVVRTSSSGDWSSYVLKLIGAGGTTPNGFDPPLAQATFAFSVDCPSDLDCRQPSSGPVGPEPSPALDYLARDYDALRVRLLDRMATLLPNWTDRSPADPIITLIELFAALGDRLSAWQDSVAAEAYLSTARRRSSVRRHARLLDYRMHEGCTARTWLSFTTPADVELPAAIPVTDLPARTGDAFPDVASVVEAGGIVFETCAPVRLRQARNRLPLYSWGDPEHVLPVGATSAFVTQGADDPHLRAGEVLILAPVGSDGSPSSGDPSCRHAVSLIADPVIHRDLLRSPEFKVLELHWSAADALTTSLRVAERAADGTPRLLAVALANVALADHGGTVTAEPLIPPRAPAIGVYRPRLRRAGLVRIDPPATSPNAASALVPDPRRAVPALELDDGARRWESTPDLLASSTLAAHVVVEPEEDGTSRLRFGDGVSGRRPEPGLSLRATYRVGNMGAGNVAADVLTSMVRPARAVPLGLDLRLIEVTNPIAARGGVDPEPLAAVRELAPQVFRTQLRAVTSADYADAAMRHPAVQRAVARRRWTGSWYAQEIAIDSTSGPADSATVLDEIAADLTARRMAGADLVLVGPVEVPLEIVMRVYLAGGCPRSEAVRQLTAVFSAGLGPGGRRGFFHADNFTFGQPLLLSDVVTIAMGVAGVDWVEVGDDSTGLRFRRLGRSPAGEAEAGQLEAGAREVFRADSNPSCPENGRVGFELVGGS